MRLHIRKVTQKSVLGEIEITEWYIFNVNKEEIKNVTLKSNKE